MSGRALQFKVSTTFLTRPHLICPKSSELHRAIDQQEFYLQYQPIVSLVTGKTTGVEALVRWQHPQKGTISPDQFVAIAEETELIVRLDRLVLKMACDQIQQWQKHNVLSPSFRVQVNVSALQLTQADFIPWLTQTLTEAQIDSRYLGLEITEHGLMQQNPILLDVLYRLKRDRISISIDDFGTGYSSLSYLQRLDVENLKVDRSFIEELGTSDSSLKLLRGIVHLAHDMDMTVTAEGIETAEQLQIVQSLGCEFAQGFYWSCPTDAEHVLP